jgi:ribose/xylose/arabinose/galactoside ABC-type transport system permease subunit
VTETGLAADVRRRPRIGLASLRTYGLVVAIVLIALFFQTQRSAFLSPDNVFVLLRSMTALAIIAFAQLLVIISGELDLSVGSVYGLAATLLAVLWLGAGASPVAVPFVVALALALGAAVIVGAINAFFTTVVRIPSFIATLGMLSIASGLELLASRASNFNPQFHSPPPVPFDYELFRALGATRLPFGIPIQILWLAVFFVVFWLIRHRTLFGFRLLAIGGNPDASRIARLPIRRYKFIVFMVCSLMAAVAGILDFSYVGSVAPNSGAALTFPVFAAVVIGGASLSGGRGTVFGTLMGAALLAVLRNGLAIIGVGAFAQLIFVGAVTIGAVTLDRLALRWR